MVENKGFNLKSAKLFGIPNKKKPKVVPGTKELIGGAVALTVGAVALNVLSDI